MTADLSGLQWKVLACVAAHDRLSLAIGEGQGCWASNERMRAMVGCSYNRLCSTLTELVDLCFLKRETRGRRTVYRVIYTDEDRALFEQVAGGSMATQTDSHDGVTTTQTYGDITPRRQLESAGNSTKTGSQYIPLNGEKESEETGENNSEESARLTARRLTRTEFAYNYGGQLADLERDWKAGRIRNLDMLAAWRERCQEIEDSVKFGTAEYYQAQRIGGEIDAYLAECDYPSPAAESGGPGRG